MSKHTPGPWKISIDEDGRYGDKTIYVGPEDQYVAECCFETDLHELQPKETALANAHLIAAAPEMLAMLIHLHNAAGCEKNYPDHRGPCELCEIIAKAEGNEVPKETKEST